MFTTAGLSDLMSGASEPCAGTATAGAVCAASRQSVLEAPASARPSRGAGEQDGEGNGERGQVDSAVVACRVFRRRVCREKTCRAGFYSRGGRVRRDIRPWRRFPTLTRAGRRIRSPMRQPARTTSTTTSVLGRVAAPARGPPPRPGAGRRVLRRGRGAPRRARRCASPGRRASGARRPSSVANGPSGLGRRRDGRDGPLQARQRPRAAPGRGGPAPHRARGRVPAPAAAGRPCCPRRGPRRPG